MKLSLFLASLSAALALGAPAALPEADGNVEVSSSRGGKYGGGHGGGGWGGWGGWGKDFTSTYSIIATPNQVVNQTANGDYVFTGGLKGCKGYYDFGINTKTETICWNIRLTGFRGEYQSAAKTATHIHEAPYGKTGPPRIAFPNPQPSGRNDERISRGCSQGPFRTGVNSTTTGKDTGVGFKLKMIERNPDWFFADVHSSLAVPGAVRGQLD